MNIIVLTSSRADYGIYLPLLKKLKKDPFFNMEIVAFGTHLSEKHGKTLNTIIEDGLEVAYKIETPLADDSPAGVAGAMGDTIQQFKDIWKKEADHCDLIICLGDRYEMFSAVASSIPFVIPVAHIHGGETTLGAIDNKFRHSLTMMCDIHFASTQKYAQRISEMIGTSKNVHVAGALSLDNIKEIPLLSQEEFKAKFGFEMDHPILVTFHPETVVFEKNEEYANELITALGKLDQQIIITMPNADTMGNLIRKKLIAFAKDRSNVHVVESLGTQGYFTCMKNCSLILGNSSSGIIEAASFGKYVVNLGKRQEGRDHGKNVIDCEIKKEKILEAIVQIQELPPFNDPNIYDRGGAADKIISVLKKIQ